MNEKFYKWVNNYYEFNRFKKALCFFADKDVKITKDNNVMYGQAEYMTYVIDNRIVCFVKEG